MGMTETDFLNCTLCWINTFIHTKPTSNKGVWVVFSSICAYDKISVHKNLAQNFDCASKTEFYLYLQSSKICLHMRNGQTPLKPPFWMVKVKPCWKGWCGCNAAICRGIEEETIMTGNHLAICALLSSSHCWKSLLLAWPLFQHRRDRAEATDHTSPGSSLQAAGMWLTLNRNKKSHPVLSKEDNICRITSL